jgi:hypothetical protein
MKHFEGVETCRMKVFLAGESQRVQPDKLELDELYIVMLSLSSFVEDTRAAKLPVRIHSVIPENGLHVVRLGVLGADLEPLDNEEALARDGYWTNAPQQLVVNHAPVRKAYFRNYNTSSTSNSHRRSASRPMQAA